jgi:hypothetical protein
MSDRDTSPAPSASAHLTELADIKEQILNLSASVAQLSQCLPSTSGLSSPAAKRKRPDSPLSHLSNASEVEDNLLEASETDLPSDPLYTFLAELEEEIGGEDKVGPPVTDSLANIVNARFENELGQDKLKEKLKIYRRPSNCKRLQTPKVNLTIWKKMSNSL